MAQPGAKYRPKTNQYRYFDGTSWVGGLYSTAEECTKAYEESQKPKEEPKPEKKAKKPKKPKKQRFLKRPKPWLWVIAGLLIAVLSFGVFWAIDNNQRTNNQPQPDETGAVWDDDTENPNSKDEDNEDSEEDDTEENDNE